MTVVTDGAIRGTFVAFEGGEGAGKTTQIAALESALLADGRSVVRTREPGGTALGEALRTLLLDPSVGEVSPRAEALLFAAARAQHVEEVIAPALARGDVVLCDRFLDSSLAYQGIARGLGVADVLALNDFGIGGLRPDLTVLLDLDVDGARTRIDDRSGRGDGSGRDRIESLADSFHSDVRNAFLALAGAEPGRYLVLDARRSPDDVGQSVLAAVRAILNP